MASVPTNLDEDDILSLSSWFSNWPSTRGVLGINGRNLDLIYTHNSRRFFPNVDDKLLCKRLLDEAGIPTPRTYHVVDSPGSLAAWKEQLAAAPDFVIKPNRGFGGQGIVLVRRVDNQLVSSGEPMSDDDITFHVLQICNGAFSLDNLADIAFFEVTVVNHVGLSDLIADGISGVADVRLIYQKERTVMAMLRLPTRESGGKANLHQGGLGVGIDLETGLTLDGCQRNQVIEIHPENNRPLRGVKVPFFEEMLRHGARVSSVVGLGYIGVDFVCDQSLGPLILEVNARPGLNIQIANQAGLRTRIQ
jgi:alpha-L-glutamate ligase-like protein